MSTSVNWDLISQELLEQASRDDPERVFRLVSQVVRRILAGKNRARALQSWETDRIHVTPVHYYSPLPDRQTLAEELWNTESELPGIDWNESVQVEFLREIFPAYRSEYDLIPRQPTVIAHEYFFENKRFGGTDALALYCMIRHFRPRLIMEVGSGFSSRIAAQAALKNGDTKVICIEPHPEKVLQDGFPGLTSLIQKKVQEVPLAQFCDLQAGDVLFIDSSHVVKIGGDVNYLFLEVLPRLAPGVLVHVHDIFFPKEYPKKWVLEDRRFWNEQYLLQAFLAFNSAYEVLLCNSYLGLKHRALMQATFPNSPWWGGGSFWMRRRSGKPFIDAERAQHQHVVGQVREIVESLLEENARILVASQGDEELLKLGTRAAWHFPQGPEGNYADDFPKDSRTGIDHLEALRSQGVEYLLVPAPASGWLANCRELTQHLNQHYRAILRQPHVCVIYALNETHDHSGQ